MGRTGLDSLEVLSEVVAPRRGIGSDLLKHRGVVDAAAAGLLEPFREATSIRCIGGFVL